MFEINGYTPNLSSLTYQKSLESPCSTFEACLNLAPKNSIEDLIGQECLISLAGKKYSVILEQVAGEITPEMQTFTIAGRDKTLTVIDSSAVEKEYAGKKAFLAIAEDLCQEFGIKVASSVKRPLFLDKWIVSPGEKIYENLEKASRLLGVLILPVDGKSLRISEINSPEYPVLLIDNSTLILRMELNRDISELYSSYATTPQTKKLFQETKTITLADPVVKIKKHLELAAPDIGEKAKQKLEWEQTIRTQRSYSLQLTLGSHIDVELGQEVRVDLPPLITARFRVKSIEYDFKIDAKTTRLELTKL